MLLFGGDGGWVGMQGLQRARQSDSCYCDHDKSVNRYNTTNTRISLRK